MATKRMFSNKIIDTDKFRELGQSAKALYFCLGMDTDDDGFASFKKQSKLHGFELGDLKILADRKLVHVWEDGIVAITHFHEHNYLNKGRVKPTIFQAKFRELTLLSDKSYGFNKCLTDVKPDESRIEEKRLDTDQQNTGAPMKGENREEEPPVTPKRDDEFVYEPIRH